MSAHSVCSLSHSKSDLSDFDHAEERPNSSRPEFGWERGGVRDYGPSMGFEPPHPNPLPDGEREFTEFVAPAVLHLQDESKTPAIGATPQAALLAFPAAGMSPSWKNVTCWSMARDCSSSALAAAAFSSTRAEFCWVTSSIWVSAVLIWSMPVDCSALAAAISETISATFLIEAT